MNFAYLDAAGILESLVRPPQEPIIPVPHELDESWKNFEKTLGSFKTELVKNRAEFTRSSSLLHEKKEEVNVLRMMLDNVSSEGLKKRIEEMIEVYEEEQQINELEDKCAVIAGKVDAMKTVLLDTNAERYGKFTCFVCMDKLIDLFIDPCGHVICDRCWLRTTNKLQCPGCRARIQGAKKIFTMN